MREVVPRLDQYLASGQMEIVDFHERYMLDEGFDPDRALQKVAGRLMSALEHGFDGLRISGSTFSLARDDWEAFVRYEAAIDRIVGSKRILALCTYSLQKWSMRAIFDVIATDTSRSPPPRITSARPCGCLANRSSSPPGWKVSSPRQPIRSRARGSRCWSI